MIKYPKKPEEKNQCSYVVCLDVTKSQYAIHLLVKKVDNIATNKHRIWMFPVDVFNDGKQFGSQTVRTKTTPIEVSVERGCLIPVGKGEWSKDFTVYFLLPPNLTRFPTGIKNLSSASDSRWRDFLFDAVNESRHFEAITEGQSLALSKSHELIKENEYKTLHDAKESSKFFEEQEKDGRRRADEEKNNERSGTSAEKNDGG